MDNGKHFWWCCFVSHGNGVPVPYLWPVHNHLWSCCYFTPVLDFGHKTSVLAQWPTKSMSLSNHKCQMTYYLSVGTFQMEHMKTKHTFTSTPMEPLPERPPTHPYSYHAPLLTPPTGSISSSPFVCAFSQWLVITNRHWTMCQWAKDPWSYFLTYVLTPCHKFISHSDSIPCNQHQHQNADNKIHTKKR